MLPSRILLLIAGLVSLPLADGLAADNRPLPMDAPAADIEWAMPDNTNSGRSMETVTALSLEDLDGTWGGLWSNVMYPLSCTLDIEMISQNQGSFRVTTDYDCYEGTVTLRDGRLTFEGDECDGLSGWLLLDGHFWFANTAINAIGTYDSENGLGGDQLMTVRKLVVEQAP